MWCNASSAPRPQEAAVSVQRHNPTGNSFPARSDGILLAHCGSRAPPLRVLPSWICRYHLCVGTLVSGVRYVIAPDHAASRFPLQGPSLTRLWGGITSTTRPHSHDSSVSRPRHFLWTTPDMDVVAGTTTFPAAAEIGDAAGYLHAILMTLVDFPLRRREREDSDEWAREWQVIQQYFVIIRPVF